MSKRMLVVIALILVALSSTGVVLGYLWGEQKNQARFYFGAQGGNVEVHLGEKNLGLSPIKDYLTPSGWYELTLITDHYRYTTPIQFSPGTATVVDWQSSDNISKTSGIIYELSPTNKPPTLNLVSYPERAVISLDGQKQSYFTPTQIPDLIPGEHQLSVSLPGYKLLQAPFTITNDHDLKLTIKLARDSDTPTD